MHVKLYIDYFYAFIWFGALKIAFAAQKNKIITTTPSPLKGKRCKKKLRGNWVLTMLMPASKLGVSIGRDNSNYGGS